MDIALIPSLVEEVNKNGYATIRGFLGEHDLERARSFVSTAIAKSSGEYAGFVGPDAVAGSGLDEIAGTPQLRRFMERLLEEATGQPAPNQEFYQLLRCLTGKSVGVHSYFFHYDSYILTLLMPIVVPAAGQPGDLLVFPNTRRIRSHYIFNALDKLLLNNKLSQRILKWLATTGRFKVKRIKMTPGDAYIFWGYRSIHANEPCDPDQVRVTALIHFGNPHAGNAAATLFGREAKPADAFNVRLTT